MLCDLAEAVRVEISEPLGKYLHEIFDKFAELELALSKVQTQLATVAGENEALKHARSSQRGEAGAQGLRGVPGRDGRPGLRGEKGAKGDTGRSVP